MTENVEVEVDDEDVQRVCDALLFVFLTGTESPYLPVDPAAAQLWARQLVALGVRFDGDAETTPPVLPAWLKSAAAQQHVIVDGQVDEAVGPTPVGMASVVRAPKLPVKRKAKAPGR